MDFFGLVLSALLLVGMFVVLRRIERWFHQHIFKVGWLVTQNYQTTTILYYTFFLPGVLLHEIIYWLAAGIFNVRAERSIQFPEAQEVGELKLNFVQLHSQASRYRKATIGLVPLLAGIAIVWFITDRIFDLPSVVQTMSTGELSDLVAALQQFLNTPDFWLWMYIAFTIGNTMFPTDTRYTKEWRRFGIGAAAIITVLGVIGLGTELYEAAAPALTRLVNVLHLTVILLIGIDVVMVLGLGLIEYIIERVTDRSATFRNGKMYTMSRQEAIAERERQRELAERRQRRREREREQAAQTGPQTVYALTFSIPGAPDAVNITSPQVEIGSAPEAEPTAPPETTEEMAGRIRIPQREKPPAPPEEIMSDAAPSDAAVAHEPAPLPEDSTPEPYTAPAQSPAPPEDSTPEPATAEYASVDAEPTVEVTADDDLPADDEGIEEEEIVSEEPIAEADAISDDDNADAPEEAIDIIADDTDVTAEDDDKAAPDLPNPRRATSPFSRSVTSSDDDSSAADAVTEDTAPNTAEPVTPASSPFKRFGTAAQQSSASDASTEETTSDDTTAAKRFGIKSFDASAEDSDDSDETDDQAPFTRRASLRTSSTSPFRSLRPRYADDADDSDTDEDESILRSTRENDAVSDLFKGLSSRRLVDDGSDADAEASDAVDEEAAIEDTPPLNLRGLGRPLKPPSVRFGKPRPAPKPTADDETNADDSSADEDDDFIKYEYEDIDEYRDYDDDL